MAQQDNLGYEDLLQIVELMKSSTHFSDFQLKVGDVEINLRRNGASQPTETIPRPASPSSAIPSTGATAISPPSPPPMPRAASAPAGAEASWPNGSIVLRSPMVGTFYRSPQPGAPAFVEVGHEVAADSVVCIIEVMKLMNSIPAGAAGVVTHILVEDAAPVEYGQPLVVLRPK